MIWPHPSRRRLAAWAEAGDDWKTQAHVEGCERCLAIVEERRADDDIGLTEILGVVLRARDELEDELVEKAVMLRHRRATFDVLGGLATVPWETMRLLFEERRPDDAG